MLCYYYTLCRDRGEELYLYYWWGKSTWLKKSLAAVGIIMGAMLLLIIYTGILSLGDWQPYTGSNTFEYSVEDKKILIEVNIRDDMVYFMIDEIFVKNIKQLSVSEAIENNLIREYNRGFNPVSFVRSIRMYLLNKSNIFDYCIGMN